MRLTLLSLPLLSLVSSQAVWNTGDGARYTGGWNNHNETITSAIVSDGVVDLSTGVMNQYGSEKGVFQFCTKLETVRLPESLRKIGHAAFYYCDSLLHVDIPSGVNEIGRRAFEGCHSLQTVTVPEGVVDLPNGIFFKCASLKSTKLPFSLRTIGKFCFSYCVSLATINCDALEGVTEIGIASFEMCSSLTSFKFPPQLKIIEERLFHGNRTLTEVELPPSLETLKSKAFKDCCHSDLSIDLPETVKNIGERALQWCRIRLPVSLSILTNGGDVTYLLHQVKDVEISSMVNLGPLVEHLDKVPRAYAGISNINIPFLFPNLKFKVVYSNIPKSFFSFGVSKRDIESLCARGGNGALSSLVEASFVHTFSLFGPALQSRKNVELPKEILHFCVTFLYGDRLTYKVLEDISATVKKLNIDLDSSARARKLVSNFRRLSSSRCAFPGCLLEAPLLCSRCKKASYCSKKHQRALHKVHVKFCPLIPTTNK